jgi:hypothetical protein
MLNGAKADLVVGDEVSTINNTHHKLPRRVRRANIAKARQASSGKVLDALNERQTDRFLHPTKGWRKVSTKRTVASTIVSMAAQGFLGSNLDMQEAFANA